METTDYFNKKEYSKAQLYNQDAVAKGQEVIATIVKFQIDLANCAIELKDAEARGNTQAAKSYSEKIDMLKELMMREHAVLDDLISRMSTEAKLEIIKSRDKYIKQQVKEKIVSDTQTGGDMATKSVPFIKAELKSTAESLVYNLSKVSESVRNEYLKKYNASTLVELSEKLNERINLAMAKVEKLDEKDAAKVVKVYDKKTIAKTGGKIIVTVGAAIALATALYKLKQNKKQSQYKEKYLMHIKKLNAITANMTPKQKKEFAVWHSKNH